MNDKKSPCYFRSSLLFWLLVSVCASVFLVWCAKKVYGSYNPKQILLLETLVVLAFLFHLAEDRKKTFSLAQTLGFKNSNPSYDIRYDYIRIFAVFCVVLLHCIDIAMPFLTTVINEETLDMLHELPTAVLKPSAVLHTWLYLGNTCFIMLTGALLFGRRTSGRATDASPICTAAKKSISSFYERRFSKIVLTSVIYFYFYMWQNGRLIPFGLATFREGIHRILTGAIEEDCPFLWLVYITLAIYIAVPFLQYMFEAMPYQALTSLSGIILLCSFLHIYTDLTPDLFPFFTEWIGMAIIGYWVSRPETRKYDRFIWTFAVLSFLIMVVQIDPYTYWQSYVNFYVHMAPLSLFMACGVFALALHKKPEKKRFFHPIITMFGAHSFSILLMHWWMLYHIVDYILGWDITWERPLDLAGIVIFVIVGSLVCGFLVDQTVVYAIRSVYEIALKKIKKIFFS